MPKAHPGPRASARRRQPSRRPKKTPSRRRGKHAYAALPALQLIYDTAPVGLAFLTPDCRYVQINQRLTEICGISVADHVGRTVRETVPQVADAVEGIVRAVVRTGAPVTDIEVRGQRGDGSNADHVWVTSWHPLKGPNGSVVGVNVVAEDVTDRKRAERVLAESEKALRDSEARFRALADNMSQFAWTADQSGWIYWYNKRWHDYTGTTLEEMQGWGWQKVHHPDHVDRVVRKIRHSFETGLPWEDTFPLRGRDGRYRWFLSRALPIRDDAGKVIRWFGTNTDVTEQIAAEKSLRELNETLEHRVETEIRERLQIWNVSQDLLVVADSDGRYLSVNPAWTTTLGWSESELIGHTSQWLLHPDDRDESGADTLQVAQGRTSGRFASRFRCKDGAYRWLSWKAVPDRGRIYAMGRDITALKETEDDLRAARRELAQVGRRTMLATMIASIAHEIRQPLGAIVANANAGARWLGRTPPGFAEARETLKEIADDGHRASDVIQSIRAIFNHNGEQAGGLVDINALARETIAILRGELEAAGIAIRIQLSDALPMIHAHSGQLQQVILNLLTNGAEAMRAVADRPRVLKVASEALTPDRIAIWVEDSGTGIAAKHRDRIFEAFFTTKSHGMGMGLTICRSVVETHGGTLSASPVEPHGSVFRIELPVGH